MKRILYVDVPFTGIKDGGANRSKFIWNSLCCHYEVDWLEIERDNIPKETGLPEGMSNHFKLAAETDHRVLNPVIIYRYREKAEQEFMKILKQNSYSLVFIRFLSPVRLGSLVNKFSKDLPVMVDVDMLLSRLSRLSWNQNKSISNRYYLLESLKQEKFENKVFNKPYLFFFTNDQERDLVINKYAYENKENIKLLPNVMNDNELLNLPKEQRILFFGTLNSAANSDSLQYIAEDIYPLLENELEKRDIYLDVVGRGWNDKFEEIFKGRKRLRYVGEVDNIQEEISKSQIVFLPLRVASGTRTRILEVANQAVPVVTTPIGVEGLDLSDKELVIRETPQKLVEEITVLMDNKNRRQILGQQLRLKSRTLYLAENVSERLIDFIETRWK